MNKTPKSKQNADGGSMVRLVRRGWRSFLCDECGHKFEWPTRDHKSPSGENCPECGEWLFPRDSRQDETLKVDDMGNLTYDPDVFPPTNVDVEASVPRAHSDTLKPQ